MSPTTLVAFLVVLEISAVFSMFGKGGGSLYTPVLVLLGWEPGPAISTALFLNLVTALVATAVFARNRLVDFRFSSLFLPGTIAGSFLGALLSDRVPKDLLLGVFSVFLLFAGVLMIRSSKGGVERPPRRPGAGLAAVVVVFSFAVGMLSSLIGVGGGLVLFPFVVLYLKHPARKAAGATATIVTVSSLVGSLGHLSAGHVDFVRTGITAIAAVLGSAVGSHITVKASPRFVKVAFAFIMWFFSGEIALHLLKGI